MTNYGIALEEKVPMLLLHFDYIENIEKPITL